MSEPLARVKLHDSWKEPLKEEFLASYMQALRDFLMAEAKTGKRIHPPMSKIFQALDLCPLERVRVVIIGQDPYHGPNQAHGLSFSVQEGVRPPPSLVNIFQEISDDFANVRLAGQPKPAIPRGKGCLTAWARQGVLLLNSVLTVVEGQAGSHQGYGWERFTDKVVSVVNEMCEHVVFLLWGNSAQQKGQFVDRMRHYVLQAPHPSPFSVHRGFFGCKHFSKANAFLLNHGYEPIDWFAVD